MKSKNKRVRNLSKMVGKLVEVKWFDISSERDVPLKAIELFDTKRALISCLDFGIVKKVTKDFMTIANSIGNGQADVTSFPICVLHSVKEIENE